MPQQIVHSADYGTETKRVRECRRLIRIINSNDMKILDRRLQIEALERDCHDEAVRLHALLIDAKRDGDVGFDGLHEHWLHIGCPHWMNKEIS